MEIPRISNLKVNESQSQTSSTPITQATASIGNSFEAVLSSLNQSQSTADSLMAQLSAGENVDVHQVMIATEENDINFRVTMAIRDRLVDAYREIMRMSV